AARHDAEIAARLFERTRIDLRLLRRIFDEARRLWATRKLLAPKALGALFSRLCRRRGVTCCLSRALARLLLDLVPGGDGGGAADVGQLGDLSRRCVRVGLDRGDHPIARLGRGNAPISAAWGAPWPRSLARSWPLTSAAFLANCRNRNWRKISSSHQRREHG